MSAGRSLPGRLSESLTMVRGVYLFPTTPQALRSRHVSVDPAIHKTRGCAAGSARIDRPFAGNLPLLCRARQGMGRCSELAIGLRKAIVENGTKRCSRMQTQVTGCSGWCATFSHWTGLRLSAKVQGQPFRQDRKRATGWKGKAGVGPSRKRARSSCVSARGLRFKGHSSLGHAVSSKGQDFCPALWHSPNISTYSSNPLSDSVWIRPARLSISGRLSQALLHLSPDGSPPLATVLTVLSFRLAASRGSRCSISGPMPSPDSGLRVPLHGSG
ncbi:uncharacterized protein CCOS01_14908 [Colletotrichum costaricense]|uniref:Uncharacterized protein n=1 Tax=Colletotrichum costaricense TaxID=1209916 RepID=A0AAI9YIP5_9PEZI|nr:uncharacterized protein CCOS01_14908 [Colletotrichum costaricense]KAK1511146.1 hypothetical protein CCOS01_14908 [Colletotrichum costaricense]